MSSSDRVASSLKAIKNRLDTLLSAPDSVLPSADDLYLDNEVYDVPAFLTLSRSEASVIKFAVTFTLMQLREGKSKAAVFMEPQKGKP